MDKQVTLEQLKKALFQPNPALKKRALAIIHNESLVEAESMLLEFMGTEQNPDLLTLSLKVLKKLQDFTALSEQVPTESLLPFLESSDSSRRLMALRALVGRRSPALPAQIQEHFQGEENPEVLLIIAQVLRSNPDIVNLPLLRKLRTHGDNRIRVEAIQAINAVIDGCLFPDILAGVVDSSEDVQVIARQLSAEFGRKRLAETLRFLLSGDAAASHLGASLLRAFIGPDLTPLLGQNVDHPDPRTREIIRKAAQERATLLAEAAATNQALEPAQKAEKEATCDVDVLCRELQSSWASAPAWVFEPMTTARRDLNADDVETLLRQVFERISFILSLTCILTYFLRGERSKGADQICFTAIQEDFPSGTTASILRTLAGMLPPSRDRGDLFSLQVAAMVRDGSDDHFLDSLVNLQRRFSPSPNPQGNPGENAGEQSAEKGFQTISKDLSKVLAALSETTENSRLVAKVPFEEGIKIVDYWRPESIAIAPDLVEGFSLPIFSPLLISRDSLTSIFLAPFLMIDGESRNLVRKKIGERHLWPIFEKLGVNEAYRTFLAGN